VISRPFSLRYLIPVVILALGLLAMSLILLLQARQEARNLERDAELALRNLATLTTGSLEAAYRIGDDDQARAAIERLAGHPNIRSAMVINNQGIIEHSLQIRRRGRSIDDPALNLPDEFNPIRLQSRSPMITHADTRWMVYGAFPIFRRQVGDRMLIGQTDWLLLEYDVTIEAALMRRELLVHGLIWGLLLLAACIVFYLFLRRVVLVRIARLQAATRAVASGDLGIQPDIRGNDEIGALAEDFRIMTRNLRQFKERFRALSFNDPQTGLCNRQGLEQRLDQVLAEVRRGNERWLLCHFDIQGTKVVNSTLGHSAGDALLRQVANHLLEHLPRHATAARISGDEFALLLPLEAGEVEPQARQLLARLEAMRFEWNETSQAVRFNLGAAVINRHTEATEDVLGLANAARLATKESGYTRLRIGHRDDSDLDLSRSPMRWVHAIEDALEHDRFELVAQEIRPTGPDRSQDLFFEILIRMRQPDGELVSPGEFLPAAERYRLADRIDLWVLENLFETLWRTGQNVDNTFACSINLSGLSLGNEEIIRRVAEEIDSGRIHAGQLCFEITETAAITNLAAASDFIERLRGMGCQFALDDFGSGVSSFGYLKGLAVDFIKIDGMFTRGIAEDPTDRAIVRSISDIAHQTGKLSIAEFVENARMAKILEQLGVDYLQGYWVGRPIELSRMLDRRRSSRRNTG
jgi:diguanylate cyclase (GGDEF)-like protein